MIAPLPGLWGGIAGLVPLDPPVETIAYKDVSKESVRHLSTT